MVWLMNWELSLGVLANSVTHPLHSSAIPQARAGEAAREDKNQTWEHYLGARAIAHVMSSH